MNQFFEFFRAPWVYPAVLFAAAAGAAVSAGFLLTVRQENLTERQKAPRLKIPGIILGFIDLLWCIPNAMPILPESLHRYLLPLAVVLTVLAWFALDHLFARAIGGFMILSAHYFLKELFAAPVPAGSIFAVLCLLFGTLGIVISGQPWRIRDFIGLSVTRYGMILPVFLILFAVGTLWNMIFTLTAALRGAA